VAKPKRERTREEKIDLEYKRISKALKSIPEEQRKVAENLMREAAYMTQIIADSRAEIDENGIIEEYQNGENQHGARKIRLWRFTTGR